MYKQVKILGNMSVGEKFTLSGLKSDRSSSGRDN